MRQAFLTVDLGFGDAGKGAIVDFLACTYASHTVVRYNGGPQAAHRVVTAGPCPQEHVFSQFGSGTLAGSATHLSRFMLLDPLAMVAEEEHLQILGIADAFARTTIDARALVITPFQRAANRLQELARGDGRHGSCGMGIGETMADHLQYGTQVLFARDLSNPAVLTTKLRFLQAINLTKVQSLLPHLPNTEQVALELDMLRAGDGLAWLGDAYRDFATRAHIVAPEHLRTILQWPGTVIFEGAQGVLLDEWYGFHPHTTWSTTTLAHADCLLEECGYRGEITRLGLTRCYATRHGPGPLVTEDAMLTAALPDACNSFGPWQRDFRVGWLDLVMLRYALAVVGPLDALVVTCLDRLRELPMLQICRRYDYDTFTIDHLVRSPLPRSLSYQEQLTHNLARCRPLLETVPDVTTLLDLLTTELGLPIQIISEGPTAEDKQLSLVTD
ncbi:MAG: adenylosuccinate synthetase [Herpetosiphonaceae bacterium]|nr:adenylosuccinate synthetase [Herpetosiphonaceae bacterium]